MSRYFLEVRYLGTRYAGFQIQENAPTVQGEIERCMQVLRRGKVLLTGSSRTDAGVHARANFFHFDVEGELDASFVYRLNALLPTDIAAVSLRRVGEDAHCRFDAISRTYRYCLHGYKDPFLQDRSWYYPYPLESDSLHAVAKDVLGKWDFEAFSKRRTQVGTYLCQVQESRWVCVEGGWEYWVTADRFLRGMVRGLVGTMLQVGRGRMARSRFQEILQQSDNVQTDFTPPGRGLMLVEVRYPDNYFDGYVQHCDV